MESGTLYGRIEIGDAYTLEKTITREMIQAFADFTGDYNPVHVDEAYCKEHGMNATIAHGMLILSFLSTLIGMFLPGEGSVWMSQSIDFLTPVHAGDTVSITGRVVAKDNSNALRLNIITMKIEILGNSGRAVARGTVRVSVK